MPLSIAMSQSQTSDALKLSVVVPCFNEQEVIETLYRRLLACCETYTAGSYEVLMIDDGSSDSTWPLIEHIAKQNSHFVGVRLSRNHGHQLALTAGLKISQGERVLIIDADLQDPPELLGEMMTLMDGGADVVYGKRTRRHGESSFKKATASLFYRTISYMSDVSLPVDVGDFRLMSKQVVEVLNSMPEEYRFVRGMVAWAGFQQKEVLYERNARHAGATKYPLRKMIRFAIDAITGFSTFPLRVSTYLAVVCMIISIVMLLYVFYAWAVLDTVPGWASLMTVMLMLSTIQMYALGIVGEYIGRTYMQTKRRPLFIVKEIVSNSSMVRAKSDRKMGHKID